MGRAVVGDGGSNSQARLPGLVLRASLARAMLPPLTHRPGDREPCATRGRDPSWNPDIVNPSGNTNGTQVKPRQNPGRTQFEPTYLPCCASASREPPTDNVLFSFMGKLSHSVVNTPPNSKQKMAGVLFCF